MVGYFKFVTPATANGCDEVLIRDASECLVRFTNAFNACDINAMDDELHFPHVMYSGAERLIWYKAGQHPESFFENLKASGWTETRYEFKNPILVSQNKVHFVVNYSRRDAQGQILTMHTNLWIATSINGKWGIALRSY
jgi:hypothetical protein